MLRQTSKVTCTRKLPLPRSSRAHIHTESSGKTGSNAGALGRSALLAGAGAAILLYSYSYARNYPVLNDAIRKAQSRKQDSQALGSGLSWDDEHLTTIAWGSNREGLISPTTPEHDVFRTPSTVPWLCDVALRDLSLHERHGTCADAKGDVYQWNSQTKGPVLSLAGKDIVSVEATPSRVFALSSSGKVYVLSSYAEANSGKSAETSSWTLSSWSWKEEQNKDYVELGTDQKLGRGEKFVSISAGDDHLLALTSSGRTFAHPISKKANSYGQLGFRKFTLPSQSSVGSSSSSSDRITVEIIPKAILDPFASTSRTERVRLPPSTISSPSDFSSVTDFSKPTPPELEIEGIRFCDRLYEIPSLRGIKVAQVAAGARASFVRTDQEGRVLAWGANENGQLGLGSTLTVDTITIPTEVIFSRSAPSGTRSRCKHITAGGDLTFFTVEKTDESNTSMDLLACGMGQWGGLGNGLYSTAQGDPTRIKAVSGLLEFNERTQSLQPIVPYALSVSPTGHVLLTIDTLARGDPAAPMGGGRDLLVWGTNRDYQLGNGKRASLAKPATLDLPGLPNGVAVGSVGQGGGNARLMMIQKQAKEVKDLQGRRWKKNVEVEQCAVAGWGSSLVYWKICKM